MAHNSTPAPQLPPTRRPMLALTAAILAASFVAVIPLVAAPTPSPTPTRQPAPSGPVTVRWFIGLGCGTQPNAMDEIGPQRAFLEAFNGLQGGIYLDLVAVPCSNARDILKTMIAEGKPPDIVGPVGTGGRNGFAGEFMDLIPFNQSHQVDTSAWEPALMDLLADESGAQIGLPYLTYPALMFYNKDLFTKAGLPDLPKTVGATYMGKPWDWNTVAEIGQQLTLDKAGKHPTDKGFDAGNIVQWGFDAQWWDGRRLASSFGGGSLVASDYATAQIPPQWADAWRWYYDAIWTKHFAPTGAQRSFALLNQGTTIASGRIAMAATNGWTINSYGSKGDSNIQKWDMAVMPSWKGQTSGPLDVDTFVIPNGSQHPDEAFEVILALMADPALRQHYGAMPAVRADRPAWFAAFDRTLAEVFPGNQVSWSVLEEMAAYPAIPSHESDMPNVERAIETCNEFFSKLQSQPGLDIDAELAKLRDRLQADFDEVGFQDPEGGAP